MKVLLINLPFLFERKSDIILSHCLGILQIASFLKAKGHDVSILDALEKGYNNHEKYGEKYIKVGLSDNEIISRLSADFDVIGISVPFSHLAKPAHELICKIKRGLPKSIIVMGGVYPSTQPELAIESEADFLILGEGEETMLELINFLSGKTEELSKSIIKSSDNLQDAKPHYSKEINIFPLPGRNLIDFEKYLIRSPRNVRGWRSASIITSKGCPFNCEFCAVHPVCGYKWRAFSSQRVLDEINNLVNNYGVDNIEIEDDNFTIDRKRVIEILNGIVEINRHHFLSWQALNGLRIDTLDEELIKLFKESNCHHLNIALEHGDIEMLRIIDKKLDLDKVISVVELLAKYQIPSHIFTIYGYPGETKERFESALAFYSKLKEMNPHLVFKFFIAQPYPNTRLYKRCISNNYLPADIFSDIDKISGFSTANKIWITTPDFDEKEVLHRKKVLRKTLFNKKEYMMQIVREKFPDFIVDKLYSLYHILGKK